MRAFLYAWHIPGTSVIFVSRFVEHPCLNAPDVPQPWTRENRLRSGVVRRFTPVVYHTDVVVLGWCGHECRCMGRRAVSRTDCLDTGRQAEGASRPHPGQRTRMFSMLWLWREERDTCDRIIETYLRPGPVHSTATAARPNPRRPWIVGTYSRNLQASSAASGLPESLSDGGVLCHYSRSLVHSSVTNGLYQHVRPLSRCRTHRPYRRMRARM